MSEVKKSNLKLYRHYKDKPYKYIGRARHSESLEELILYETRYENELGSLWVRPKAMFFENVEAKGRNQRRFEPIQFKFETTDRLSDLNKVRLTQLLTLVFGEFDGDRLTSKLADKTGLCLITAFDDQEFAGFKLGYQTRDKVFYSWLGAVHPRYQGIGLGKELLNLQHAWCRRNGYDQIETKTLNKWKTMLLLNIQSGFDIIAVEERSDGDNKIVMAKRLGQLSR